MFQTKRYTYAAILLAVLLAFTSTAIRAEEKADALARRLERQMFRKAGLTMSFALEGQGKITVRTDLKQKRIRIESPKMLIISDGKTIWNLSKTTQQVTIDAVAANSPFSDPASLFRFAENYTARSDVSVAAIYQVSLTLVPKEKLHSLLKAAGDVRELRLDLIHKGEALEIRRAAVIGANGAAGGTDLYISTSSRTRAADFVFTPTKRMKVTDLRE